MRVSRAIRITACLLVVSATTILPPSANASSFELCTWDEAAATLVVRDGAASFLVGDVSTNLPCRGTGEGVVLPPASQVRHIRIEPDSTDGDVRVTVRPQALIRSEARVDLMIGAVPNGATRDVELVLDYDSVVGSAAEQPHLAVHAGGVDLDSDGVLDISLTDGQPYSTDIRSKRHLIGAVDLRELPARASQKVRASLYSEDARHVNRFWGPRSGAWVMYWGSDGRDVVDTFGGDDAIFAGNGPDEVRSGGGADYVNAKGGNDRLWGGAGDDTLSAGGGDDLVIGGPGTNSLSGGGGRDVIRGGPGRDFISDSGFANAYGFGGSDDFDVSGITGGRLDCGTGLDFRHHLSDPNHYDRSCERWTARQRVFPAVSFEWTSETHKYLCSSGWFYRPTCPDPRRR